MLMALRAVPIQVPMGRLWHQALGKFSPAA
jgi:hypothetical protein